VSQDGIAAEFASWFEHNHDVGGWQESPLWFIIGDLPGPDDGDRDILIYMANEAPLAAAVNFNWQTRTLTLEPLWFWLSPYALEEDQSLCLGGQAPTTWHSGSRSRPDSLGFSGPDG
jgi:hypothetical protein